MGGPQSSVLKLCSLHNLSPKVSTAVVQAPFQLLSVMLRTRGQLLPPVSRRLTACHVAIALAAPSEISTRSHGCTLVANETGDVK